jgi:hypothetical protein
VENSLSGHLGTGADSVVDPRGRVRLTSVAVQFHLRTRNSVNPSEPGMIGARCYRASPIERTRRSLSVRMAQENARQIFSEFPSFTRGCALGTRLLCRFSASPDCARSREVNNSPRFRVAQSQAHVSCPSAVTHAFPQLLWTVRGKDSRNFGVATITGAIVPDGRLRRPDGNAMNNHGRSPAHEPPELLRSSPQPTLAPTRSQSSYSKHLDLSVSVFAEGHCEDYRRGRHLSERPSKLSLAKEIPRIVAPGMGWR